MPHYHGLPFNWWQPPIQYYFFQLRVMKRNELGKWSVRWTSNNLDNDESIELTWNHLNVRMNKIINSNRKEAEKLKHALTQYKPKFDEVALCDAIMKEGKNDSDKYSYQLLEAWVNINKASFTVPLKICGSREAVSVDKLANKTSTENQQGTWKSITIGRDYWRWVDK